MRRIFFQLSALSIVIDFSVDSEYRDLVGAPVNTGKSLSAWIPCLRAPSKIYPSGSTIECCLGKRASSNSRALSLAHTSG